MRKHTKILARSVVLAAAAWFVGCNSTIDDEPNVVLEVENMIVPPIIGAIDSTTLVCAYTVTNATATFKNKPKNTLATTSPFNDIVLQSVSINYIWDDGAGVTAQTFGLGGTVPANGSSTGQFSVVNANDVTSPDRGGHTASLQLTFHGTTVSGEAVSVTTGGTLTVNTCQ
jgi:hypothetical protein